MSPLDKCKQLMSSLSFEFLPTVYLTNNDIDKAIDFGNKKAEYELNKNNYGRDKYSLEIRFAKGILGEIAVENLINEKFANLKIGDRNCRQFKGPDLKSIKLNIGVKSFILPYVPIITTNDMYYHQIILNGSTIQFKRKLNDTLLPDTFIVLGVASPKIMMKYSDRSYVSNINIESNKLGFYGLDKIHVFHTKEELIQICQTT